MTNKYCTWLQIIEITQFPAHLTQNVNNVWAIFGSRNSRDCRTVSGGDRLSFSSILVVFVTGEIWNYNMSPWLSLSVVNCQEILLTANDSKQANGLAFSGSQSQPTRDLLTNAPRFECSSPQHSKSFTYLYTYIQFCGTWFYHSITIGL